MNYFRLTICAFFFFVLYPLSSQEDLVFGPAKISGLTRPVDIANAGDGTNRIFVVEQRGNIYVYDASFSNQKLFLNIQSRVNSSGNEQGLLGLTFDPNYSSNGYFYVYYVRSFPDDDAAVLSRFRVSESDPDVGLVNSETIIMTIPQNRTNHNGGDIAFGPQGNLYIATGDGGGSNDPADNSQDLESLLGKMLRIDVSSLPYTIPASNPFSNATDTLKEIFFYGLRNPWRFSFDGSDIWIADVGQWAYEEISVSTISDGGSNFGWNCREGLHDNPSTNCPQPPGAMEPILEIPSSLARSITGGFVYRGSIHTSLSGQYIVADYVTNNFWMVSKSGNTYNSTLQTVSKDTIDNVSSFGVLENGEILVASLDGAIYQIGTSNTVFPISIVDFKGTLRQGSIDINWTTGIGVDFCCFELEKSMSGIDFQKIHFGNYSPEKNRYHHKDSNPEGGTNYYRLKKFDSDGGFSYSKVIGVYYSKIKGDGVSLRPNPVKNTLFVQSNSHHFTSFEIYSPNGTKYFSSPFSGEKSVNISHLPAGVFLLKLISNNRTSIHRFIKN
jgi:glucose/arabinose dehydrogenase